MGPLLTFSLVQNKCFITHVQPADNQITQLIIRSMNQGLLTLLFIIIGSIYFAESDGVTRYYLIFFPGKDTSCLIRFGFHESQTLVKIHFMVN
jgi:hypothetical protein